MAHFEATCTNCGGSAWGDEFTVRGAVFCDECAEETKMTRLPGHVVPGSYKHADPMQLAEWFMDRWERETGASIGEGAGIDLTALDDCLRDYSAQCAAQNATASLFEATA